MMMSTKVSAATELPTMIELPWMKSTIREHWSFGKLNATATYQCDDKEVIMEIILCILE